jgi:hypothetical protein
MTIIVEGDIVTLSGRCVAEDAEPLLKHLLGGVRQVDVSGCNYLHGAVVQLLMAARPAIVGEPEAGFLRDWLIPLVREPNSP